VFVNEAFFMPFQSELAAHVCQTPPARLWWKKLWRWLFSGVCFFTLASVVMVGLLRWLPVPTSSFMLYRHYQDVRDSQGFKPIRYAWINYDAMSRYASQAVIASEDQHFFQHAGFDVAAIEKAIAANRKGKKIRGASTISQQVAKNLFLTPSRSYLRKGVEAWFTFLIEHFWTKQRILEVYLNVAEFGDHLFGIESASYRYFGISAKKLSAPQAALLAATLPNPLIYQADKPSGFVFKRQRWILRQMRNLAG
jgi:monofunctional biosynthetic peptidoglycan transglycosylase